MINSAVSATKPNAQLAFGKVEGDKPVPSRSIRVPPQGRSLAPTTFHGSLNPLRVDAVPFEPGQLLSPADRRNRPRQSNHKLGAEILALRAEVTALTVANKHLQADKAKLITGQVSAEEIITRSSEFHQTMTADLHQWGVRTESQFSQRVALNEQRMAEFQRERGLAIDMLAVTNAMSDKKVKACEAALADGDVALHEMKSTLVDTEAIVDAKTAEVKQLKIAIGRLANTIGVQKTEVKALDQALVDLNDMLRFAMVQTKALKERFGANLSPAAQLTFNAYLVEAANDTAPALQKVRDIPEDRKAFVVQRLKGDR